MIIDLHLHTAKYSSCSSIDLEAGVKRAKNIGLDGICITDHDSLGMKNKVEHLEKKYDILIFVGIEVLTNKGDILVFGLDQLPQKNIKATKLLKIVKDKGGVVIGAHPYRQFNGINRALGDNIEKLDLTAIEAYNGNTIFENNNKSYYKAKKYNLQITGGSDAHSIKQIGKYATYFSEDIKNVDDLISSLEGGNYYPVKLENRNFIKITPETFVKNRVS